ncbi:MAG: hypothetical protein AB1765_07850 [Candidatus Hydrogenedentota bacterium]
MERRQYKRLKKPVKFIFFLQGEEFLRGEATGVNPQGFAGVVEPTEGKRIARRAFEGMEGEVEFDLKAVDILPVKCEIIRSSNIENDPKKVFMAFKILNMDSRDKKMLLEYISRTD